ncbi:MAG: BREX system P-loop protein BrxC [Acidobacteria bacterium]|nr:BREX system P-loop protein BrxC [Acidobacteriota bacterium]
MSKIIRELFDANKKIDRTIEKVITYGTSQESRLRGEIAEYIVTESIEQQFTRLLERMQDAMNAGGENEIGVWVSGFYGSGKSSFTKYLGLAFDNSITVDNTPFLKLLEERLRTKQAKALLGTVTNRFPAAVVMLDLAGEMLAGATLAEVSSVLYFKVLQWAGYSRNLKVAAFERRLEKDGRWQEFEDKLQQRLPDVSWKDLQDDPLVVDSLIPQIAHELYPQLFLTPTAFNTNTQDFLQLETQRVEEMLAIIREKSGKEHVIFVVDELGQYIGNSDPQILNTQGLAQNLKRIGNGKVWFITTAQQTLTEDDPRVALNSGKLYKLKDRFPIQIELESSDIKEICYRRLLSKSPDGEEELGKLFDAHGQALRHNTKLKEAKFYDSDFDRKDFIDLYPFLPAHFSILLYLLGALAKTTGGVGLRSAIKVIQDVLVEGNDGRSPAANQPVGWLATTVTFYDSLEKEIRRSFSSIHQAATNTITSYKSPLHTEIAKTVAVLQILGNLPVNAENIAGLIHPSLTAVSRLDEIRGAVEEMLNNPKVPLSEKDGELYFLSEKLRDIEATRGLITPREMDVSRILNTALQGVFDPLPRVSMAGNFTVTTGLKVRSDSERITSLAGENNPVQLIVNLTAENYDTSRSALVDESRDRKSQNVIFLIARENKDCFDLAREIHRCQQIAESHRNELNQEIKDYCATQLARADALTKQLKTKLKQTLSQGSFIFRGQYTAVTSMQEDLLEAAKKFLAPVAEQVFSRYAEAGVRADTSLAEKFLKVGSPKSLTAETDPLNLVHLAAGNATFRLDHKAILSVKDYIEQNGSIDGKRLLDHFSDPPFGWSQDTLRYILAAMLVAGEIKLKVSGREVTAAGQQAIEALKTNKSFGPVGVSLRDDRPSMETLARASERLTELLGELIIPHEPDISKACVKQFPGFQKEYGPLSEKLKALHLNGATRIEALNEELADVLETDGSDVPQRIGSEVSALYDNLKWAGEVKQALGKGLDKTILDLQTHQNYLSTLPDSGVPGTLRDELTDVMTTVRSRFQKEDFYRYATELNSSLNHIQSRVREAVTAQKDAQRNRIKDGIEDLQRLPEWAELTQEERGNVVTTLEALLLDATPDLDGFKKLLARDYDLNSQLSAFRESIRKQGREKQLQRLEEERAKVKEEAKVDGPVKLKKSVAVPANVTTAAQLEDLILQLQELKQQMALGAEIELNFTIQN